MSDPKNSTPVEDISAMGDFPVENIDEMDDFPEEETRVSEPEDFPTKDRGTGATKRRRNRKARRHDKGVKEILTDTADKRGESAREGAKPIKQKLKNADKRCKHARNPK